MIKSETGTVSMRGTTPVLVSELAFMVKGMRESFAKEYGESAAEELIIMKGLINDTFDILSKARSNRDNTGEMPQALKEVLRKMLEDTIMH